MTKNSITFPLAALASLSLLRCTSAYPHPGTITSRQSSPNNDCYANWPTYADLPLDPSHPPKAAWGVWGANDSLGALNHITPSTILAASSLIRTGQAIPLNLLLDTPDPPVFQTRRPLLHFFEPQPGYTDDVLVMNTQISTQYDGLRHVPYSDGQNSSTYRFYNDLIGDYEEVIGAERTAVLGIQEAAEKGIAGRGVLLDFRRWAEEMGMEYDAFTFYPINTTSLDAVAAWQGLPVDWSQPGDILLIRTGWIQQYATLNATERWLVPVSPAASNAIGIEASDESAAWLWEKKLALVGGDNPGFEALPLNGTVGGEAMGLHPVLIAGWGTSILEYMDVDVLAETLHRLGRSTFFMTIQPLNVRSGVASPANAVAIL